MSNLNEAVRGLMAFAKQQEATIDDTTHDSRNSRPPNGGDWEALYTALMDIERYVGENPSSDLTDICRQRARDQYADDDCEIDDDAIVSMGDDPGAFVAAWVWVDLSDVMDCECGRKLDQCATFHGEEEHDDL